MSDISTLLSELSSPPSDDKLIPNTNNEVITTIVPSGAEYGALWYNLSNNCLYRFDGAGWKFIG